MYIWSQKEKTRERSFKVLQKSAELRAITQTSRNEKKNVKSIVFALCWMRFSNGGCGSDSRKHTFLLVNAAFLRVSRTENWKRCGKGRVKGLKAAISERGNALWNMLGGAALLCIAPLKKQIAWRCFQHICLKRECWEAKRGLVSVGKDISLPLIRHFMGNRILSWTGWSAPRGACMLQGENYVLSSWFEVGQGVKQSCYFYETGMWCGFFSIIRSPLSTVCCCCVDCTGLSEACVQPLDSDCSALQQAVFLAQNILSCLLHR